MAEKTKKIKKTKSPKIEKKYPRSKLPSIFKKAYSSKKFEGKIEKKLYVPADKTYVSSLFKQSKDKKGRDVLCVPAESEFTKKEIKRLKLLSKQIKANKGRIKIVPLIAVATVIAALGITVTIFKNPVAKIAIRRGMQGIFGAKCDVGSVDIQFFDSHVTIENLAQASSDDEFKNFFEFKRLDLNFNLTNLLQAKFHAQNIEITGIELGTERKTSGKLAVKAKDKKEKAKKSDSVGFLYEITTQQATEVAKARTEDTVERMRMGREVEFKRQNLGAETDYFAAHRLNRQADVAEIAAEGLADMGNTGISGKSDSDKGGINPAAMMAGMMLGGAVGGNMANMMNGMMGGMQGTTNPISQQTPPPLTTMSYFVAENGQQTGPFMPDVVKQMISQGRITRETLVWRQGMAAWEQAAMVSELAPLFMNMPPKL